MHLEALALFVALLIVAVKDFTFVAGMKQLERQVGCLPGDPFGAARAADVDAKRRLIDASGIKHEK